MSPHNFQTNDSLLIFCEKNSDGTKKLRLKGKELQQRFNRRVVLADVLYVCNFIQNHDEITDINLSYNEIGNEGLNVLCKQIFAKKNSLVHLNLMHCNITIHGVLQFYFTSQLGFVNLKILRLCGNKLEPSGGHIISLLLKHCLDMEYLDLGNTDQTAASIDWIFLNVYFSKLKVLNVSRAIPQPGSDQVDSNSLAGSLSELLRVNSTLVEIHIQKCNIDAHGIESLMKGLKNNETLTFLDIGYNNICCVGVEFLAELLKRKPPLLALNIAGNNINDHGALALSFAFCCSKIRYLDISSNKITDKGFIPFLNCLKKPYLLRFLFIWGNKFGPKTNAVMHRLFSVGVLQQNYTDVNIYSVDGVFLSAYYPVNKYKHKYYDLEDYGYALDLKIKKNYIEIKSDKPRALVNLQHVERFPPLEPKGKASHPRINDNQ